MTLTTVESDHAFLPAYAARNRETDGGPAPKVWTVLAVMQKATADIVELLEKADDKFARVVTEDARKAGAAIALVFGQESIGSEVVDNASTYLWALLTALFLVNEVAMPWEPV